MRNHWTRERIIRYLLDREAQGLPLTVGGNGVDVLLYEAARRMFGSWRRAIQAAGIAPQRVLTWERWSPARILVLVRNLARRRQTLTVEQMERRYDNLVSAARRHFGSWGKAVVAAGVDPSRLQRVVPWTRERVIETILTRALRNQSLVARFVEPRSLVAASQRLFGSWSAAVVAAGLDPTLTLAPLGRPRQARPPGALQPASQTHPARHQRWTKQSVIAALQARVREHKPVNATALARENHSLYQAMRRHLKNWTEAMRAAGLDPMAYRGRKLRAMPPEDVQLAAAPQPMANESICI